MNKDILNEIHNHIKKIADPYRADISHRFFKTGKGEYGEGDIFIGLTVPQTRRLVKVYSDKLDINNVEKLLQSRFHDERLLALLILIDKFEKAKIKSSERQEIFDLYFKNIKYINNWDLVDTSAPKIVGKYIKEKYSLKTKNCSGVKFLNSLASDNYKFAKNQKEKLWEKRIAIISTLYLIMRSNKDEYASEVVFEVVKKNLYEKDMLNTHDLLQKASGWMLREYGKRISKEKLKSFLNDNFEIIKKRRTLLRYSIEKLNQKERLEYLNK